METTYIKKDLKLIQLLRCVACILVVLFHFSSHYFETFHKPFLGNAFVFGGAGVDIFFVLSGFIITFSNRNYVSKKINTISFFKKRIIRIFPIYWIILSFFLFLQIGLPTFYKTHFLFTAINLLKTYFLLPNHIMVNGVSWTLTNELFFYLLFMLSFLIPNKKLAILLLFIYLALLTILPFFPFTFSQSNLIIFMLLFPMNIEFLLGILIVFYLDKLSLKWCIPILFIGVFLILMAAIYTDSSKVLFPNLYNRVVLYGIPSFLIILSLVKLELTHQIFVPNLFLKLGNASYSIYLFHLPLVAAFFKIIEKFDITNFSIVLFLICCLLIFICWSGIFIFNRIETPLIKYLNKIFFNRMYKNRV